MPHVTRGSLLAAIRRRPLLVLVVFLVPLLLGWIYVFTLSSSYSATGVVSFQPRVDESNGRDLTSLLARRYPEVAQSDQSVGDAAIAAGVSTATLQSGLTASVAAETLNLSITSTLDTPEQALAAVQSVFKSVVAANADDPYLEALSVQPPARATEDPGPPKLLLALGVVVLAAIVAVLAALIADLLIGGEG
ncbi:MAG: hypothetical protein KDC23_00360 [Actinobacteria bacterium]|nr:hypothetical protein [Actinomycetota bacterium]